MYEVCMSADSRVEPNFNQNPDIWAEKPQVGMGAQHLVYEEDTSNGIGGLLIKSGMLILFSIAVYGGYLFLNSSRTKPQLLSSKPTYDWSGRPSKTDDQKSLSTLENQEKTVRKIDLTKTASIYKPKQVAVKTISIKPQPKVKPKVKPVVKQEVAIKSEQPVNGQFHIVQPGDTISAIGRKFQMSAADIMEINGITNPKLLKPGMKVLVTKEN